MKHCLVQSVARLAFVVLAGLGPLVARGADLPTGATKSFGKEIMPGLVESNGMYIIDVEMEAAEQVAQEEGEELLPASTGSMPLGINEALAIYAELTGAGLHVDEDVRQFSGLIHLPTEIPPMTRALACSLYERALEDQVGLEIMHLDDKDIYISFARNPTH